MPAPLDRPVVIWGPPASGKSTLARALGAALGVPVEDTDARVEHEAGTTIARIFAGEGEAGFRARERRALDAGLSRGPCVLAAGGGALAETALRHDVLRRAYVLSLDAPIDTLAERAARDGATRPLLAGPDAIARLAALLALRAPAYHEAHARVGATGDPAHVLAGGLDAVASLTARRATLVVPLGERTYRVLVASLTELPSRVAALAPSRTVLVTDRNVARAWPVRRALAPVACVTLAGRGDRDKSLGTIRSIWDAALDARIDRDAVLVAAGGGVVTDMTGFAAATLLRGVRYASAPTTLLAMVDASVGGKTGFDHARGKNLIGAFHHPSFVLCDPRTLTTTTPSQLREGLAEAAKIALVRDAPLLAQLERDARALRSGEPDAFARLVAPAIQAKIDVVVRDEREAGERALLNFGHTLGHAIESASRYRLAHGACVAIGMRAALALGVALGVTPVGLAQRADALFDALELPSSAPGIDRARVLDALGSDKKRRAGALRFVLCDAAGSGVVRSVGRAQAAHALDAVLEIRTRRRPRLPSR